MMHVPVMVKEVLSFLLHENSKVILDATVGCGGHAKAILDARSDVSLIGIDRDPEALRVAAEELAAYRNRIQLIEGNFAEVVQLIGGATRIDGALADLGVSSLQLNRGDRGFSYRFDGPLDMRMGGCHRTAKSLIEDSDVDELAGILKRFGEVSGALRIARAIKAAAEEGAMVTTADLHRAIDSALRGRASASLLSKVFQAIRIALNDELQSLSRFLEDVASLTNENATIVLLSYHSLEDRIVKEYFRRESTGCLCPPRIPICVCAHVASVEVLTRRVVRPSRSEVSRNVRARSARLRASRVIRG